MYLYIGQSSPINTELNLTYLDELFTEYKTGVIIT